MPRIPLGGGKRNRQKKTEQKAYSTSTSLKDRGTKPEKGNKDIRKKERPHTFYAAIKREKSKKAPMNFGSTYLHDNALIYRSNK